MSPQDPWGSSFFRFCKCKQISVDGNTLGLEYQRRHSGNSQAPPSGHAAQHNHDGYDALNSAEQYHPGRGFYSVGGPEYESPPSWHDTRFSGTPPIRHSSPPSPMLRFEPATDDDSPDQQPLQSVDIQRLFDLGRTVRMTIDEIRRHTEAQRAYVESVMTGEVVDAFAGGYAAGRSAEDISNSALMDAAEKLLQAANAMNALEQAGPEFGDPAIDPAADEFEILEQAFGEEPDAADAFDQQMNARLQGRADVESEQANLSLDEIVEREIQQYDPFGAQDPFGPYDPFGPTKPNFGPFGPMGPGY